MSQLSTYPQEMFWAGQRLVAETPADKRRINATLFQFILDGATDESACTEWRQVRVGIA